MSGDINVSMLLVWAGHQQQRVLCVGTVHGMISVWTLPQLRLLHTIQGHMYSLVTSLCVDKDGLLLASGKSHRQPVHIIYVQSTPKNPCLTWLRSGYKIFYASTNNPDHSNTRRLNAFFTIKCLLTYYRQHCLSSVSLILFWKYSCFDFVQVA